jgi:hypothetical protein
MTELPACDDDLLQQHFDIDQALLVGSNFKGVCGSSDDGKTQAILQGLSSQYRGIT